MTPLDAMKQALDALENAKQEIQMQDSYCGENYSHADDALAALKSAITEMEKAEPVAWMNNQAPSWVVSSVNVEDAGDSWTPLFVHPVPSRNDVIEECAKQLGAGICAKDCAAAIRELKRK